MEVAGKKVDRKMNVCKEKNKKHIPALQKPGCQSVVPFQSMKKDFERDYYRTLLIKFNGNITRAAQVSGIERAWFSKKIKALGLSKENVIKHTPALEKSECLSVVPFQSAKKTFERDYYRTLLIKFNDNISRAAQASGIERAYFSKRAKALRLSKETVIKHDLALK